MLNRFFNLHFCRPNIINNDPKLQYDVTDGWLNEYIPDSMPIEGTMVNMSFKTMVKGQKYNILAGMVQLHRNAKGVITADVVNP